MSWDHAAKVMNVLSSKGRPGQNARIAKFQALRRSRVYIAFVRNSSKVQIASGDKMTNVSGNDACKCILKTLAGHTGQVF